ncbi:hypothetical protein HYV11_03635 [Candidatus Dependentiae bacterium]|nr:hypothetical protein [Candidatus Dependentiae bacterium]
MSFYQKILFLFILNVFSLYGEEKDIYTNHYFDQRLFLLQKQSALCFYNDVEIKLKKDVYEKLIQRWQLRLENSWLSFYENLEKEINLSWRQLFDLLNDKKIAVHYYLLKEKVLDSLNASDCVDEKEADPYVINFIKKHLQKYCSKKNIKVALSPSIRTVVATYGSDATSHFVICNSLIYTRENIQRCFPPCVDKPKKCFRVERVLSDEYRCIEWSNLLAIGLIEAASYINHQNSLLSFLVSNIQCGEKKLSLETQKRCLSLIELQSLLEAILQSKNPLESALFISQTKKRSIKEEKLWNKLVQELAACYAEESLSIFYRLRKEILKG